MSYQSTTPATRPDTTTKEIISGSNGYRPDGATKLMSTYSANCTAVASRMRFVMPCAGEVIGAWFSNTTGGTVGGEVVGEGAGVSSTTFYGNLVHGDDIATLYPLYGHSDVADRDLLLAANQQDPMHIMGAIPVNAGDIIWAQMSVETAAVTDTIVRHQNMDYTLAVTVISYNDATPANNTTSARAQADTASWSPTPAAKTSPTSLTHAPGPAGIIMRVKNSIKHVVIWGTSRESGFCNPYVPTNLVTDAYPYAACEALGIPYLGFARGSARGYQDLSIKQSDLRRRMTVGATHWFNFHNQNDIANRTITQYQAMMVAEYKRGKAAGCTVVVNTIDPWVQSADGGAAGNALWDYSASSHPVADATTEAERIKVNAWLTGPMNGLCTDGDGVTTKAMVCDVCLDTAAVVSSSTAGQWLEPVTIDSGTSTATAATTLTDSGKTWTLYANHAYFIKTLTAADAVTWAYIRSNGTTTVNTLETAGWSNGTAGSGKAYTIYKVYTPDGIHASYHGRLLKQAVVQAYLAAQP